MNTEAIILIATDAYGIGINNLDINLVVQWDHPINFDSIIQCIGYIEWKRGQTIFILFIAKWSQVKDVTEIELCFVKYSNVANANFLLSISNKPQVGPKQSRLS